MFNYITEYKASSIRSSLTILVTPNVQSVGENGSTLIIIVELVSCNKCSDHNNHSIAASVYLHVCACVTCMCVPHGVVVVSSYIQLSCSVCVCAVYLAAIFIEKV